MSTARVRARTAPPLDPSVRTRDLEGRHVAVLVIGGGQAGLSVSACLAGRGIDHLVLDRRRELAWEWRARRWDSFCLVTPNWQCQLPGFPYRGDQPDGFMAKDEIIRYVEAFVEATDPPLVQGVEVTALRPGFVVETTAGTVGADQVVIATGPYNIPTVPALAADLPGRLHQLHSSEYRSPAALPDGEVLVVGTGQSGCQIAEDLHRAGRRVHLAVGAAPRVARRYRGKDCVKWLDEMGYYEKTVDDHPLGDEVRRNVNHYVTGRDGGHDIDLRRFALEGMQLYGHLGSVGGSALHFADDLAANLDGADRVAEGIKDAIDEHIDRAGVDAPTEARYVPVWQPPGGPRSLDLSTVGITSVVWSTGFRPDYSWLQLPILDERGRPSHRRGVTDVPGAFVVGLPWLHTWGSARFSGIAQDADHVAGALEARTLAA